MNAIGAPSARLTIPDFDRAPMTVAWEITRACPLRCVHCRADAQHHRDPGELSTQEGFALIDQAVDLGAPVFVITGGDPLARPDVFDLIELSATAGLHTGFSPSVTARLTDAALVRAVDAGAGTIHLSLDGATAATHDRFRGVRGSFDRTLAAIDRVAALDVRLQVGTTVSSATIDELEAIVPLLAGRVDLWTLFVCVPTGRADTTFVLTPEEHEHMLHFAAERDLGFPIRTVEGPALRRLLAQQGRPTGPAVNDGRGFCFVSHTGEVCPSGFLQVPVGNVRDRPLAHWYRDDPLFRALRDPTRLTGKCGRCEYRDVCGGSRARAWSMLGDPFGSDPICGYEPSSRTAASRP